MRGKVHVLEHGKKFNRHLLFIRGSRGEVPFGLKGGAPM